MQSLAPGQTFLERKACLYTSCYCEENVYFLVQELNKAGALLDQLFVVFISNAEKHVPLWRQRSGGGDSTSLVVWDYHVLAVQRTDGSSLVWDLDSTLPWPCSFHQYALEALGHGVFNLPPHFTRLYRVVRADAFFQHFASDRSHMQDGEGGYQQPPPPYPCIVASGGITHTLPQYVDMPPLQEALAGPGAPPALQSQHAGIVSMAAGRATIDNAAQRQFGVVLAEHDFVAYFGGG